MNEPLLPEKTASIPAMPSRKAQSWGALISIVIIVLMVVGGAFYTWGKRISETHNIPLPVVENQ